jgi:hypothetical protein
MKIITLIFIAFSSVIIGQDYDDYARWIFFGRQASAKTESMGRIVSLDFDNNFLSQSNPASLINSNGFSVFYSQSNNYYAVNDAIIHFGGFSYNSNKYGAFALNTEIFYWGEFIKTSEYSPEIISTYISTDQLYTLTYSNSVYDWFSFGINANLLKLFQGSDYSATTTYFDFGLLRKFSFINNSLFNDNLTIGGQLKNIFNQNITFKYQNNSEVEILPIISNIGISYGVEFFNRNLWDNSYLTKITLGSEYQFLLNSKYRNAYKFGGELSVLDILYFRFGYYKEINITKDCSNCLNYVEDTTYGFGLNIDFIKLFKVSFPLIVKIDYINIPQPTYVTGFGEWDNFNTISLGINYNM